MTALDDCCWLFLRCAFPFELSSRIDRAIQMFPFGLQHSYSPYMRVAQFTRSFKRFRMFQHLSSLHCWDCLRWFVMATFCGWNTESRSNRLTIALKNITNNKTIRCLHWSICAIGFAFWRWYHLRNRNSLRFFEFNRLQTWNRLIAKQIFLGLWRKKNTKNVDVDIGHMRPSKLRSRLIRV